MSIASSDEALALVGIEKRFGPVCALAGVDLAVDAGEVHALLGENGAGKTTLMNLACGVLRPDAGEIRVRGQAVALRSPRDGFKVGVGMVHQSYRLVGNFTVAENVHLGWDKAPAVASARVLEERVAVLSEQFGLQVKPGALAGRLSVGEQQRVAILRTLARGTRVLVLDEPTAALTPVESERLFQTIRGLVAGGHSVVFISHKLREVIEIADRISVLRGGKRVATLSADEATMPELARLMVGEGPGRRVLGRPSAGEPARPPVGDAALVARDVSASDDRGGRALSEVTIELRRAEILGVAGVSGNGQSELTEVITGLRRPFAGSVIVGGEDLTGQPPSAFIVHGVGHIPEDPRTGLALSEPLDTNAVIKSIDSPALSRGPWLRRSAVGKAARRLLAPAGLSGLSAERAVRTLSGGQAQRLLVQREIEAGDEVLVAVHPTRGLDVGATAKVHGALTAARDQSKAVLLISEDLDEVLDLSDRIVVLYEGRIIGTLLRAEFDRDRIGALMGGLDGTSGEVGKRLGAQAPGRR